jgi:hypothetical protein
MAPGGISVFFLARMPCFPGCEDTFSLVSSIAQQFEQPRRHQDRHIMRLAMLWSQSEP